MKTVGILNRIILQIEQKIKRCFFHVHHMIDMQEKVLKRNSLCKLPFFGLNYLNTSWRLEDI